MKIKKSPLSNLKEWSVNLMLGNFQQNVEVLIKTKHLEMSRI